MFCLSKSVNVSPLVVTNVPSEEFFNSLSPLQPPQSPAHKSLVCRFVARIRSVPPWWCSGLSSVDNDLFVGLFLPSVTGPSIDDVAQSEWMPRPS